jgi:hypothetical protein
VPLPPLRVHVGQLDIVWCCVVCYSVRWGLQLGVLDNKLGGLIKEKLGVPCVYNGSVLTLIRGIRSQVRTVGGAQLSMCEHVWTCVGGWTRRVPALPPPSLTGPAARGRPPPPPPGPPPPPPPPHP